MKIRGRCSCRRISAWTAERQPKLVEIQGFPTLYAYQPLMAACYREAYGLDDRLTPLPDGLGAAEYRKLLREAIVGTQDPENVVLLEIDPWHQKTRHDFLLTERLLGVRTVDIAHGAQARQPAVLRSATAWRLRSTASTTARSWMNWCASRCRWLSIFATSWTWNGPGIPTGSSA